MNKNIAKKIIIVLTSAWVLAAVSQWMLAIVAVLAFESTGDLIIDLLRGCRAARAFEASSILLGISVSVALPSFWFCARRLGSRWRVYHLCSVTLGCALLTFHWLTPIIWRAL